MVGALNMIGETAPQSWAGALTKLRLLADDSLGIDGDPLDALSLQQVYAFVKEHAPAN